MNKIFINQKARIIISIANIVLLFVANYLVNGTVFPEISNKGLWFLCCLLNIILANQLLTPYFTKPVDSISFSVTCLVSIVIIKPETTWDNFSLISYNFIICYTLTIILSAILCIILRDSKKEKVRDFSEKLNLIVSSLGTAKIIFSFLFLFSLITYHREISEEILIISITYLIFIIQSPIDYIY